MNDHKQHDVRPYPLADQQAPMGSGLETQIRIAPLGIQTVVTFSPRTYQYHLVSITDLAAVLWRPFQLQTSVRRPTVLSHAFIAEQCREKAIARHSPIRRQVKSRQCSDAQRRAVRRSAQLTGRNSFITVAARTAHLPYTVCSA
jgi:hypothetical protein